MKNPGKVEEQKRREYINALQLLLTISVFCRPHRERLLHGGEKGGTL